MLATVPGPAYAPLRGHLAVALVAALALPAGAREPVDRLGVQAVLAAVGPPALSGAATPAQPVQGRPKEPRRAGGCWARGVWYPEGTVSTNQAVFGVQTLSPVPARVVCRRGTWVTIPG